MHVTISTL